MYDKSLLQGRADELYSWDLLELLDSFPFSGIIVHLEIRLTDHVSVGVIRQCYPFLSFCQSDINHMTLLRAWVV